MKTKTIDDRAYDFAMREATIEGFDFGSVKDGYIQGARDQRKIDIDKACEWLYNDLANLPESVRRGMVREFRKAMEE